MSRRNRTLIWHAVFWLLITVVFLYDRKYLLQKLGLGHFIPCILVRISLLMGLAYWHLYGLVPRFWQTRRYGLYALALAISLLGFLTIQGIYDTYLYGFVIGDEAHKSLLANLPYNAIATVWYLAVTVLLKLALDQRPEGTIREASVPADVVAPGPGNDPTAGASPPETVWLKSGTRRINVALADILYVQGLKDYSLVITGEGRHIIHGSLKAMESRLPTGQFIRVHKSFLVARHHIRVFRSGLIELNNQHIPVGRTYRKAVESLL